MGPPFEQTSITTYPWTICVQYQRILLSSFGEEDFQSFSIKLTMFKIFWAIILLVMYVAPPKLNKL